MPRIEKTGLAFALAIAMTLAGQIMAQQPAPAAMPLSNSPSASDYAAYEKPLTFRQQMARYEAIQRTMRIEMNKWYGYSPLRPNTNSSYMNSGLYNFYPARQYGAGFYYTAGNRSWGW